MDNIKIDFEEFKKYLEYRKKLIRFVHPHNDKIYEKELIEKLKEIRKIAPTEFEKCFTSSHETNCLYIFEVECKECKKTVPNQASRQKFIDYLKENNFKCDECKNKEYEKNKEKNKIDIKKQTEIYIERYLDPENSWHVGVKYWQKWNEITMLYVDHELVADHIKSMDYYEFLNTPYWKAISEKMKSKANWKCQLCNSNEKLATHHRTYDHHGYEIMNLKDLIVLCTECHEKFHDIDEDNSG